MKKKSTKRTKKAASEIEAKAVAAPTQPTTQTNPSASTPEVVLKYGAHGTVVGMPDPRALLIEADQEPNYRDLADYAGVIQTLKQKGFTYREIAEWLSERGLDIDHNAVYRVYTKEMSDLEQMEESRREEEEA